MTTLGNVLDRQGERVEWQIRPKTWIERNKKAGKHVKTVWNVKNKKQMSTTDKTRQWKILRNKARTGLHFT